MIEAPQGEPAASGPPAASPTRITQAELERAISAAEPSAFLVLPRILRRVIKQDRRLTGFALRAPHRKAYLIGRDALLEIVDRSELGVALDATLPGRLFLLAQPDTRELADTPAAHFLVRYWRLLFHLRVHAVLEEQLAAGRLTPTGIRRRIERIGRVAFDEARAVLCQEGMLLPPETEESVYVELAATYWELRYFALGFLPRYFPALNNPPTVESVLGDELDARGLFRASQPRGAAEPGDENPADEWSDLALATPPAAGEDAHGDPAVATGLSGGAVTGLSGGFVTGPDGRDGRPAAVQEGSDEAASPRRYRLLMRRALRPAALGNVVRAAIWHARAQRCAPPELAGRARAAIRMDVDRLTGRLQAAFDIRDQSAEPWQGALFALVHETPRGRWTREARLLYDLQKVCMDYERDVYKVSLAQWALSLGRRLWQGTLGRVFSQAESPRPDRRPLRRRLPNQREALMLKHLRSAAGRLPDARLPEDHRRQLARLMRDAIGRIEARLRERIRPQVDAALQQAGLAAGNLPESVARKKLIEELLDRLADRGFLNIGDLRDAISRNNLKLPDLSGPVGFLHGDQLLRADRRLASMLDGVYRRSEIYMRWLQRLSAVGFGTGFGRFLTRFAVVPFGGAYVVLAFFHELRQYYRHFVARGVAATLAKGAAAMAPAHVPPGEHRLYMPSPEAFLPLALLVLLMFNSPAFRRAAGRFSVGFFKFLRAAVVEPVRWLLQSPWVQRIFRSRLFTLGYRFLVKPLLWTAAAWFLFARHQTDPRNGLATGGAMFLAFTVLLNSRLGRNAEEATADWLVQAWHRFGVRPLAGLFWFFVDVFRAAVEWMEQLIYSVDEWLRFRSGESRATLAAKALLGVPWSMTAYVLRIAINVFIEPQINPIKHFPVVTVSHKLLLGAYVPFAHFIEARAGLNPVSAVLVAGTVIWCIPGVFGFLVWELKENWRLYAANRRPNLSPVPIGSHGENMGRLLRPGLHSGTLPKRFARLRRAERRARAGGAWRPVFKHLRALRQIELMFRRYVDRDLIELLRQYPPWMPLGLSIDEVRLATNSVQFSIASSAHSAAPLRLAIAERSGWLVAGVVDSGWARALTTHERQSLRNALVGLYKSAGIGLVRQQLESEFPPPMPAYEISDTELVFWPDETSDAAVVYDLRESPWIAPRTVRGRPPRLLPTIERRRILFQEMPVAWVQWVELWSPAGFGQSVALDALSAPVL